MPVVIKNPERLDLVDWVIAVQRKRGIFFERGQEREGAEEWLKTQNIARIEALKESGAPVYSGYEKRGGKY